METQATMAIHTLKKGNFIVTKKKLKHPAWKDVMPMNALAILAQTHRFCLVKTQHYQKMK